MDEEDEHLCTPLGVFGPVTCLSVGVGPAHAKISCSILSPQEWKSSTWIDTYIPGFEDDSGLPIVITCVIYLVYKYTDVRDEKVVFGFFCKDTWTLNSDVRCTLRMCFQSISRFTVEVEYKMLFCTRSYTYYTFLLTYQ